MGDAEVASCPVSGPHSGAHAREDRLVPRPRVVGQLAGRFEVPVTAVVARAGYGKSTALHQAVAANREAPLGRDVVLGLARRHRSAPTLLRELAAAVGAPGWDPDPFDGADAIVEWCHRQGWRRPVALVLDDAHLLGGGEGEHVLRRLAAGAGASLHLVLASRTALGWLATVRSRGAVADVDEEALRLDDDELVDLAARRGVEPHGLRTLGGWPAVVDLVATYGTHEADAFVDEEVLATGPVDRPSLVAIAAIGGGDAEVLHAVLGRPVDPGELAARVPLTSLDPSGELRIHQLWSELLGVEDEDVRAARRLAAQHWCRHGQHQRAVELALRTGDEALLTDALVGAAADRALADSALTDSAPRLEAPMVSEWRASLPSELAERPVGRFLRGADAVRRDPYGDRADSLLEPLLTAWADDAAAGDAVRRELVTAAFARGDRRRLAELGHGDTAALCDVALDLLDGREPRGGACTPTPFAGLFDRSARAAPATGAPATATHTAHPVVTAVAAARTAWHVGDVDEAMQLLPGPTPELCRFDRYLLSVGVARWRARAGRLDDARGALGAARGDGPPEGTAWAAELTLAEILLAVAQGDRATASAAAHELVTGSCDGDRRRVLGLEPLVLGCLLDGGCELTDPHLDPTERLVRDEVRAAHTAPARVTPHRWPAPTELLVLLPLRWVIDLAGAAAERAPAVAESILTEAVAAHGDHARRLARDTAAAPMLARTAVPPRQGLRLEVFGPVRLRRGSDEVDHPDWERLRVRELLCHLALCGPGSRDSVAAALWPDADPADAANSLRTHLSMLHGVLEPDRWPGEATSVVCVDADRLSVAGPPVLSVDAVELRDALARSRRTGDVGDVHRAVESWRGHPLAGLDDAPWVDTARATLVRDLVDASLELGADAIAAGAPDRAVVAAIDALQLDPWNEAGYQLLVSAYLAGGDRAAALRALDRCDAMLDELGVPPDATTLELRRRVG